MRYIIIVPQYEVAKQFCMRTFVGAFVRKRDVLRRRIKFRFFFLLRLPLRRNSKSLKRKTKKRNKYDDCD